MASVVPTCCRRRQRRRGGGGNNSTAELIPIIAPPAPTCTPTRRRQMNMGAIWRTKPRSPPRTLPRTFFGVRKRGVQDRIVGSGCHSSLHRHKTSRGSTTWDTDPPLSPPGTRGRPNKWDHLTTGNRDFS